MKRNQYKTSVIILGALVASGIVLQFFFGGFDIRALAFPVNLTLAALVATAVGVLALYRERAAFGLLSGVPFAVVTLASLLCLCLVMGLIPQHEGGGLLTAVTSSWPFVFVYLVLLLALGCVAARGFAGFDIRRWGFYLNHIGLWLVLAGAGFGRADYRELTVKIPEGETAMHGMGGGMMPEALPFAMRLDDFRMEEYPSGMPKEFTSEITATFRNGEREKVSIEVNHPYRRGSWSVYQSGYDRGAGPASSWSILKAVRDPWLGVVCAGIVMLALGALSLIPAAAKYARSRRSRYLLMLSFVVVSATVLSLFYILRHGAERMPALQSIWLTPHIVAYMLSYMMFAAATVGACIQLRKLSSGRPDGGLYDFTDGMVYAGFALLTLGMLMGMVWAKAAWGHYWTWDPKETWALATALAYLLYIHMRRRDVAPRTALWMLPLAFVLLMITWLGVNYLPAAQSSVHVY